MMLRQVSSRVIRNENLGNNTLLEEQKNHLVYTLEGNNYGLESARFDGLLEDEDAANDDYGNLDDIVYDPEPENDEEAAGRFNLVKVYTDIMSMKYPNLPRRADLRALMS